MKVYLDANVLIEGGKHVEANMLKGLAEEGAISLYISNEVLYEQQQRSLDKHFAMHGILDRDQLKEEYSQEKQMEKEEEEELAYWRDVELNNARCTFSGLVECALLGEDTLMDIDRKGELELLEELITTHRIGKFDALHVMTAHSACMDYLLTWDRQLIRKARRIGWLRPAVTTAEDFMHMFEDK